jgi:uncharacterized protein YecE (DUF72 family)
VDRTDVVFNNCYEDAAQRNAATMIRLLNQQDEERGG